MATFPGLRGCEKMEESFRNAGVLAYCRSFVPNEKTIRQDRGIDSRLRQPSDKKSQGLRARPLPQSGER